MYNKDIEDNLTKKGKNMLTIEKLKEIHLIAMNAVPDKSDTGACGFAWVNVRDIRKNAKNPDRNVLEAFGFSFAGYEKCFQLWVSNFGQNILAKEQYAGAFAEELRKIGFKSYAGSRMD